MPEIGFIIVVKDLECFFRDFRGCELVFGVFVFGGDKHDVWQLVLVSANVIC
jgi:hypothetical protein